tara:strand:- start:252 stop:494 length:243 start_codon:yes stop_codon:yes gene_type:complete
MSNKNPVKSLKDKRIIELEGIVERLSLTIEKQNRMLQTQSEIVKEAVEYASSLEKELYPARYARRFKSEYHDELEIEIKD